MEHRRDFLSMLAGFGAVSCELQADDPPRRTRAAGVIQLPPPLDKQNATFSELYIEPGKHSTPHRHAGFVLGYVIEGEFRFQISGEPERILRAGDIFYEPPGVTHLVSESASAAKPARVLAIIIADSETKKLTEPA